MYSWSYKVMTHLVTPEGRYRVSVPSAQVQSALRGAAELEAISNLLVKDSLHSLADAPIPTQNETAKADTSKPESLAATSITSATTAAAIERTSQGEQSSVPPTGSEGSKPECASGSASSSTMTDVDAPTAAATMTATALKPLVSELDGLERAMLEHFEILCFVLIEFWRQKLILCLKKTSSATPSTAAATATLPPTAAASANITTTGDNIARAGSDTVEVINNTNI